MHPKHFSYARPESLDEAVALLATDAGARPLAGGQTLLNVLKQRVAEVSMLVDISRLEELRFVRREEGGSLEIGAAMRYREIAADATVRREQPLVAEVADDLVDVQVRNRGTIGGNVCLNDPTSNYPPLLVALGATMRVAGPAGPREVASEEFFSGPYRCRLEQGELLRSIALPPLAADAAVGYQTLQIARDSWALARAAVWLRRGETVADARVVLGCVGPRPLRQRAIEGMLVGTSGDAEAVAKAAEAPLEDVEMVSDVHATAAYRLQMARVYVRRAIEQAVATSTVAA